MAQDTRHITEGFDFSSADRGKKKLNAFSIIDYFINTPLNNLTTEDKILIRSIGKLPERYHKVYNLNDLRLLIYKSLNVFGSNCDLNWIDVSNITTMVSLFRSTDFAGDISRWDVSHVTSMKCMFYDTQFCGDISRWDVSNVKDMRGMFEFSLFNNDISRWDVSNVKDMEDMFRDAYFNKDISAWNVGNVITMKSMFEGAEFCGDISRWDVSNVKNMGSMFCQSKFNGDISKWDVGNVFNMSYMFSESVFNGDISSWDVGSVSDMSSMFAKSEFTGNIGKWDVSNVKDMDSMFFQSKFNGNINEWNIKSLRNMNKMFYGARFIKDISKWDIAKVQYKEKAFTDSPLAYLGSTMKCRVYETFDFSTINGKKAGINISGRNIGMDTNSRRIFYECPIKEKNKPKSSRTKIQESFDFNVICHDKSKAVSRTIAKTMENPHNAAVGDYLYRDKNGKYTLKEIDVPWGICVIEARDTPDNKARFMGLKNATGAPITGISRKYYDTGCLCCFGGEQDIFSDYYIDYNNPETSWNGDEISQAIYNATLERKINGIPYDAVNFCKEYDVHRTEKNWKRAPETGWYCPAYSELWNGVNTVIKYIKEHPDDPRLEELNLIFNKFWIYGIWSCSMFRKEGTFGYYIAGHRMGGYKKKIGWQKENGFVALPFISF